MTHSEQPTGVDMMNSAVDDALAADSRERAVGALLRYGPLRRLWSARFTGGVADVLGLLVLLLLALHAAVAAPAAGAAPVLGGGYQGVALAVAAVFGARLLAALLFGVLLLGPLSSLTAAGGHLDRRWTMIVADALRVLAFLVAPLWQDWMPRTAFVWLLATVFVTGAAERVFAVAKDSTAPALLPAPPAEGAAVRPLPDRHEALRRLWLRSEFLAFPVAATALIVITLVSNLLGTGISWFTTHQAALAAYVAAGLFAGSLSVLTFLHLPDSATRRPRSPLEGLRATRTEGRRDKGRTGALRLLVLGCSSVAGAIGAAVALSVLEAADLGAGPVGFGLLVLALTGGTALGIRLAPHTLRVLSRRRLFALAIAVTGIALLAVGLTPDTATVCFLTLLAGIAAGIAAHTGHVLLDQEAEERQRPRTTAHLLAVVRLTLAAAAVLAPVLAAVIGPHRIGSGDFVFAHDGAAFALMLVGALLLPVAALVLGRTDDRHGVSLRRDLREAFRGGEPAQGPAAEGFFIAVEGGDGAGKSTQVEALADWIRAKGHEVVVTREPGATPLGKRLRSILLDVSSAGLTDRAEALLYAADRAEHVDTVVRPALERGAVVITDRYIDSSVAYQGAGRDLSPTEIARISRWATDGLVPHLTVLLDISPQTARERFTEAPDRLESEPDEFHRRVRAGFLSLAAADPARYVVVDAGQEPEAVTTVARHRLDQMLPLSQQEITAREEARRAAEEEARRRAEEEAERKAEEERREREREEQLRRLREEEAERKRRDEELQRQREEARRLEESRQRAEENRRRAEEERARREAEETARREEEERRRRLADEEERLRSEAEERRREKQRRAEESLLRSEDARRAAEGAPNGAGADETMPMPRVDMHKRTPGDAGGAGPEEETTVMPAVSSEEETTVMPAVSPDEETAEVPEPERTREMPRAAPGAARPSRERPDWAEETPLDDVPSLADELLGSHDDEDDGGGRRTR
ncbi:dTMP kinase [Streptomyces sp. TR06-5]|uniref:dTMP kinase n=1 Tax=Streptomyces sp. TR06-5 TaxID=3385976 RepID=UPI00399F291F